MKRIIFLLVIALGAMINANGQTARENYLKHKNDRVDYSQETPAARNRRIHRNTSGWSHGGHYHDNSPARQNYLKHKNDRYHYQESYADRNRRIATIATVAHIFRGIVHANKCYKPMRTKSYVWSKSCSSWWPHHYVSRVPHSYCLSSYGNIVYYTSSNIMMGVNISGTIITTHQGYLHVWQNGMSHPIHTIKLHDGASYEFKAGSRWVEVFYNGTVHVNYMESSGQVIESYALF